MHCPLCWHQVPERRWRYQILAHQRSKDANPYASESTRCCGPTCTDSKRTSHLDAFQGQSGYVHQTQVYSQSKYPEDLYALVMDSALIFAPVQQTQAAKPVATDQPRSSSASSRLSVFIQRSGVPSILMDGEFVPLKHDLFMAGIVLNTTAAIEHVPKIERQIRVIKEHVHATRHTLPFKMIPLIMLIDLIYSSLRSAMFPPALSIRIYVTPWPLVFQR
jgi:hypothetical protein